MLTKTLLKYRLPLLLSTLVLTTIMAVLSGSARVSYNAGKILPISDPAYLQFEQFKKKFGEDATIMVIGLSDSNFFRKDLLNDWYQISLQIQRLKGISAVASIPNLEVLKKDTLHQRFVFQPILKQLLTDQQSADSLKKLFDNLPFYKNLLLGTDHQTTLMAITFNEKELNNADRGRLVNKIYAIAEKFGAAHHLKLHYSGQPYIRTRVSELVSNESLLFLSLSVGITMLMLWWCFRSGSAVIVPMVIVIIAVVWSFGFQVLMGYDITVLTGIVPPLLVIIGVPNSIILLNAYRQEYRRTKDRYTALLAAVDRSAITLFIANITTAIGFGVLCFTASELLTQFGLIASISIMLTFGISLVLLPIIFSYLPPPSSSLRREKSAWLPIFLQGTHRILQKRKFIYGITIALIILAFCGIAKISVNSFVVDELPQTSGIKVDLHYFERNFNGVLPLEVTIDTKRKYGVYRAGFLPKMVQLENLISSHPEFGKPMSLIPVLKYTSQTFFGGDTTYYQLPSKMSGLFILNYLKNSSPGSGLMNRYVDADKSTVRMTFPMKDVGSKRLNLVLAELKTRIDTLFPPQTYQVNLTGSSILFIKGANYMVKNLYESLLLAILLIAAVMMLLFRNFTMVIIAILPNVIPLVITAGMMGFCGIPLKPSTILIFSIAMGISSDQTIYFLTRYKQKLLENAGDVALSVRETLLETGASMVNVAAVLFFGFGIFTASSFGGTVSLGLLLSFTLLFALLFNLTLLPAFLLSKTGKANKNA